MKTVLNKILVVSNNPTVGILVELLKGKLDAIEVEVQHIENLSGKAYQTGDEVYTALDKIKSITQGAVAKISVTHFLVDHIHKDVPNFEGIVDVNFVNYQHNLQTDVPTLGKLFSEAWIPVVDDQTRLIIKNRATIEDMLVISEDRKSYTAVKEQFKNVPIKWER